MNKNTVSFVQMKDGTREDYLLLDQSERDYARGLPDRILETLRKLDHSLDGYKVSRLEHSLQTATRAEADGADEEMIVAALVHDIGDELAPYNHAEIAAGVLRPYVRPEVTWVVAQQALSRTTTPSIIRTATATLATGSRATNISTPASGSASAGTRPLSIPPIPPSRSVISNRWCAASSAARRMIRAM
jgi:hypothetical protein